MPKRLTRESFIERASKIHSDKYDYSKVEYVNAETKVTIICPDHGEFVQSPKVHYHCGCPMCDCESRKKLVYGVGINDLYHPDRNLYQAWVDMISRCYNEKSVSLHPTYSECTVCDDWLTLSKFAEWYYNNHVDGYHLDKDILSGDKKIYSPETCCYVPQELNKALLNRKLHRGDFPVGVIKHQWGNCVRYSAHMSHTHLGYYSTPQEAFLVYKEAKEQYVKELSEKYYLETKIPKKVYEALQNYMVSIDD